ncbi:ATP-dependent RecD-like DNA helicase [Myxococcota bacterium]|nr:ATP-dependent RecD-like DNA helicase [Myxococcota bacterium]MBU1537372.1 ATP-dependent RecD-like DNA helicase [Myxococcota bacterium]
MRKPYETLTLPGSHVTISKSLISLTGEIISRIFVKEETGFAICRFLPAGEKEPVTVLGTLGEISEGLWLTIEGEWETNQKYGDQLRISHFRVTDPKSREGMIRFLSSSLIRGIGPSTAEKIVNAFGDTTFSILDKKPHRLQEISGIGPRKAEKIIDTWKTHRHLSQAMVYLQGYGVGPATAHRIIKRYKEETVEIISNDPYRLAEDVWGIGFRTADRIALSMGVLPDSPKRIQEALVFTLSQSVMEGHTYLPQEILFTGCLSLLDPIHPDLDDHLQILVENQRLKIEEDRCYTLRMWHAEMSLTSQVQRIMRSHRPLAGITITHAGDISLSPEQQQAVESAFLGGITIITGGPGTGKTTLVKAIVEKAGAMGHGVVLSAPTGRAAKRLSEAAGMEAKTLHRLLEYDPRVSRFTRGLDNPLEGSFFITDEVSMVDLPLMNAFARAIPQGASLVLVGDVNQLPSVGPGTVLKSFIQSGRIPTFRLTTIYRQAAQSAIIRCSHQILTGEKIDHGKGILGDFFFIERDDPEEIAHLITHLVSERIPGTYGLHPLWEIQVLVPRHKGDLGTERFNRLLQGALNPKGQLFSCYSSEWRVGDKVLQTKNNYDVNVFNGDMGVIEAVDLEEGTITIRYDDRTLTRPLGDLTEMVPAYAISIHKSQGSEYPAVVIPLHTQHSIMLQRNLLYTAVTRARKLVVIVGSQKALRLAVSNNFQVVRNETLSSRLAQIPADSP